MGAKYEQKTFQASKMTPETPIVTANATACDIPIHPDGSGLHIVRFICASVVTSMICKTICRFSWLASRNKPHAQ